MKPTNLIVGGFVVLPDASGFGRLDGFIEQESIITLFHSFVEQEQVRVPTARLVRGFLYPGTRVYPVSEDEPRTIGRVVGYCLSVDGDISYEVQFPNRRTSYFSESDLRVRCWRARGDPIEVLAAGIGESQFLHDRRYVATKHLILGQASVQGLTGLGSSGVEFVSHQVSVVRRVLSDPLLRYLLADEVGLGKTIEAGIIIRQILIDDPNRYVGVLVPRALVSQWQSELREKFYADDLLGSVEVFAHDEFNELDRIPDLLVIDEAHHMVGDDFDGATKESLTKLAHQVPRLLLLSATPALANPQKFLSLLNLLDPKTHKLDDLAMFESKLGQRQEFGRLLLGLLPESPGLILRRRANDAKSLFPDDPDVQDLADRLVNSIQDGSADVAILTSELGQHIADTYRINQRVIRYRRSDAEGWEFQARGPTVREGEVPGFAHVRVDDDEDRRIPDIVNALEDWRAAAISAFAGGEYGVRLAAALRYRELVEALGIGVEMFADVMLSASLLFPGEKEIREGVRSILESDPGPRCKLDVAEDSLRLLKGQFSGNAKPKIVAFCSATPMVEALYNRITQFDPEGVCAITHTMDPARVERILKQFLDVPDTWLLIADRSGEEGLNLNFADAIFHFDLPLSATRIEQRIGRVDRFGRRKTVIRHRILLPYTDEGSVWLAWKSVLSLGFRVFHEPISDVQFLLDKIDREFALAMFEEGVMNSGKFVEDLREKVAIERKKQDEQYALDRIALADDSGSALIEKMDEFEENEGEFGDALESWLVGALQLKRSRVSAQPPEVFGMAWGDRTLAPRWPWESQFGLDNPTPMTWRRRIAITHPGVVLQRLGSPLLDSCQRFMRWDDRGATFLTLRVDPVWPKGSPPWLVFKLCFVIEADLPETSKIFSGADDMSGLRRAQQFLPPSLHTIYLDAKGIPITDPRYLEMLEKPYWKTQDGRKGDLNLGSRPELLAEFIDPTLLSSLCVQLREQGRRAIFQRNDVRAMLDQATKRAHADAERRKRRLLRRSHSDGIEIQDELHINQKVALAVEQAQIRLDAIGMFVISGDFGAGGEGL